MYYAYITTNPRRTVFYSGVSNNINRRIREHREEKGKQKTFAGRYSCHKLIYHEEFDKPMKAIKREKEFKNMSREKKIALIKTKNPKLLFYKLEL
jgi:putative endonuclease